MKRGSFFRGVFLALSWALFASSWVPLHGVIAASLGGLLAIPLARASRPIRSHWVAIMGLAALLLGVASAELLGRWSWTSALFGPTAVMQGADVLALFGFGLGAATFLEAWVGASKRWLSGLGALAQAAIITSAVASTLLSHRDGMIARPLELSDWFYTRGVDPVIAFAGVGALAGLLVLGAWLRTGSKAQGSAALALALLFVVLAFGVSRHSSVAELLEPTGPGPAEKRQGGQAREGGGGGDTEPQPEDYTSPRNQRSVAVVVFHRDVQPLEGYYYFRSGAFSRFNGVRLVEGGPYGEEGAALRFPTEGSVVLDKNDGAELRTMVATDVAYLADLARPIGLTDPIEFTARPNPSPVRFSRMVHVLSEHLTSSADAFFDRKMGGADWDADTWQVFTEAPDDPRYVELAAELVAELRPEFQEDPYAKVLMLRAHLEETTTYSFRKRYDGEDDPTAAFLFPDGGGRRIGYCVHNAHAVALLARSLGIPARVSTGYAVPARRRGQGSALLISGTDAHAWAEIRLRGVGWVPIEVVPEESEVEPREPPPVDLQQLLGEMAREEGRFERARTGPSWAWMVWIPRGLLLLFLALFVAVLGVRLVRQWAPRWARADRELGLTYRAVLDNLACMGHRRRRGESWEAFARRLESEVPSLAPLTRRFLAAALSEQGPPRSSGPRLQRTAQDVWVEAREAAPTWRRWMGLLEIWCWMKVR
ncbi:MAG: transglutaminase-like domain-containing protein [Myxococcota bacterium]